MTHSPLLQACVRTLRYEAEGVVSLELTPADGGHFPSFEAGSHVDLHLPNGLIRSYSLLNSTEETDRYVLGILSDPKSRGGSSYVHQSLRVGAVLPISAPRNNFKLDESAEVSVLIAGGIGITPILCMYRRLRSQGKKARVVYCARARKQAGFIDELTVLGGDIEFWFDDEHDGQPIDLAKVFIGQPAGLHAYCCGPLPMLSAYEAACEVAGVKHVHLERFAADASVVHAPSTGYTVYLKRSDKTFDVPANQSLLDTLLGAGIDCEYSCKDGVCGACETSVIEGCPDHRDHVLSAAEKANSRTMMICVSGSKGCGRLVLDL